MNGRFYSSSTFGLLLPAVLIIAGLQGTGCATSSYPAELDHYVLQFDRKGTPVEPAQTKPGRKTSREGPEKVVPRLRGMTSALGDYDAHVEKVLERIEQRCKDREPCKVLFFVHGGLSNNSGAIRRAMEMVCGPSFEEGTCDEMGPVFDDGSVDYPLFVVWNSSLLSTYRDHLLRVQRGRDIGQVGVFGAPAKLVADTGKTVARTPIVWYEMLSHDLRTIGRLRERKVVERDAEDYFKSLEEQSAENPDDNARVARCISSTSPGQRAHAFVEYVFGLPFKLLATPFVDGLGSVSWDVMLRRTDLLFEEEVFCAQEDPSCEYELVDDPPLKRIRRGGLARFLDHLEDRIKRDKKLGKHWAITLIGHSIGSIIVNKMLERYPELPVKNVVHMASAGTIGDYERSTFSLLRRDDEARVYNLVLHPVAELRERYRGTDLYVADLAPRGSLLVWIDNFLSKPNSMLDRTAGRFANIARSVASTPAELKSRVQLKVFGLGNEIDSRQPQKHGEFSQARRRFWESDYWKAHFSDEEGCDPAVEDAPHPIP